MRVQGESLQLQAEESVELRLGNAGVVDLEVNGKPYDLHAQPGQVRAVTLTAPEPEPAPAPAIEVPPAPEPAAVRPSEL